MEKIVLFDGVCNFCNSSINFIIRHDREKGFRFAPLQSDLGEQYRQRFAIGEDVDSVVLIEDEKAYLHSTAALRIAKHLGGIWSLASVLLIVPDFVRDWFYKLFARNRYSLFGRKDVCMIPTPDVRERFLT